MREVGERLHEALRGHKSVVDLGAGKCPWITYLPGTISRYAGVDAYRAYLELAEPNIYPHVRRFVGDMREFDNFVPVDFDDAAMMIDALEHIDMADATTLLEKMKERFKKIVLFIPLGEHKQDADPTGMGQHDLMTHKSTWDKAGLEAFGFDVEVMDSYHYLKGENNDGRAGFCVWQRK